MTPRGHSTGKEVLQAKSYQAKEESRFHHIYHHFDEEDENV